MPDAVAVPTRVQRTGVLWFDSLRDCLARFPLSITLLAGRVGVGSVFFKAGLSEVQLAGIHVPLLDPATAARIAMAQELTIPILLFLGLATRVATLPLLGMILVIQTFVYPAGCGTRTRTISSGGSILVLVLTRGPGVFSLDYLIERWMVRRTAAPAKVA